MLRTILIVFVAAGGGLWGAAPVPPRVEASVIVARLSDESQAVRTEASALLRQRPDAAPWLRRAARSADPDTAKRAIDLLAPGKKLRQEGAKKALDACIRTGHIDLFTEWHQYWQPEREGDLWEVGPVAAKAGLKDHAKLFPQAGVPQLDEEIGRRLGGATKVCYHDGPYIALDASCSWRVRTDRVSGYTVELNFASIADSIAASSIQWGYHFILGWTSASQIMYSVLVCDGPLGGLTDEIEPGPGPRISASFVCVRGAVTPVWWVTNSVLLVDGDIDLSRAGPVENSVIRASGKILLPKRTEPKNCTIEANAKNATAPYKFFELADVGVSLVDDEEGLVVAGVKADTPFGNCGLAKGDIIVAIDGKSAGHSEVFRKQVRKAMVTQGDCLLTVARGTRTLDLAVFFPTPK